jgi:hypothetical protein
VGSLVADLARRHPSGRTLIRVNPETLSLGELVDCLRETGAIRRAERSCGKLGVIDRTDIEAFLKEFLTYLDQHVIL